ncbi:MAG: hypothetical protein ABI947_05010 [Chloroflexota bacterium]
MSSENYGVLYRNLLDTDANMSIKLGNISIFDFVKPVSVNGDHKIVTHYHFRYGWPIVSSTVVENSSAGTQSKLPKAITDNEVRWSSDGKQLAYYSQDENKASFLVMANADGSFSHVFPLPSMIGAVYFEWSPDNLYLVIGDYFSQALVRASDNQIQMFSPSRVDAVQWSPQGHQLGYLFSTTMNLADQLNILNPDTGSQLKFAQPTGSYWWEGRILWSPDMRYIAVVGWDDSLIDVFGQDGSTTHIAAAGGDDTSLSANWLMDTESFIFVTDQKELIAYHADTGKYETLATNFMSRGIVLKALLTSDKQGIIFAQKQGTKNAIVKLDLQHKRLVSLMSNLDNVLELYVVPGTVKLVAVVYTAGKVDVFIIDIETQQAQLVLTDLHSANVVRSWLDKGVISLAWSLPAGSFGWDSYDPLTGNRFYRFLGPSEIRGINFAYFPSDIVPIWSPDHRYAVITGSNTDDNQLAFIVSSDGKFSQQIYHANLFTFDGRHMLWSPDSSKVAVMVNIGGKWQVELYTAEGKPLAVIDNSVAPEYLAWTACEP